MDLVMGELIIVLIVNLVFFFIIVGLFASNYNGLIRRGQGLREAWSQIETQLQRRYDAILAMSRVIQGYASHEQIIDTVVAKARSMIGTSSLPDRVSGSSRAETEVSGFIGHVVGITDSFPELKADKHFQELLKTVQETGNVVAERREAYNKEVSSHNAYLGKYPTKLYAMTLGFEEAQYFGSSVSATGEIPDIVFSQQAAAQGAAIGSSKFPPGDNPVKELCSDNPKQLEGSSESENNAVDTDELSSREDDIPNNKRAD